MSRGVYIPELDNVYATNLRKGDAKPIYFEYLSKYRRIMVLGDSSGHIIEVSYKGVDVPAWSKRYKEKEHAIAWAKQIAENRDICLGMLTICEPIGVQKI
ncbi:hypothetical protein [Flagellimonas flava]|uniref:hypothetical protein n=1 Tax=Flagellimonas flava TaxID=570519 RepID=UPI003D657134